MNTPTGKPLHFRGYFISFLMLLLCFCSSTLRAQDVKFDLNERGQLSYLYFPSCNMDTVAFNQKNFAGPTLLLDGESLSLNRGDDEMTFMGNQKGLNYSLKYAVENGSMRLTVSCKNISKADMKHINLAMRIGIDNCMTSYPQWLSLIHI